MKEIGIVLFLIGVVGMFTLFGRWIFMINTTLGILYIFLIIFVIGWVLIEGDF